MTDWEALASAADYGEIARLLISSDRTIDFEALAADPFSTLNNSDVLTIEVRDAMAERCAGGGYYRRRPPTIYLHPSIRRRDNFTLIHELGHHIQQHHTEWGFTLMDMNPHAMVRIEEAVSNEIAIQVLMPWRSDELDARDVHPADVMGGLFQATGASRSAVVQRVAKLLPAQAKWILAVANLDGRVQYSTSTYSDSQPARDFIQPGFSVLADEAETGTVRRRFHEGVRYKTGCELHDMKVEAALDHEGRYLFVALTPEARFGTGQLVWQTYECPNPACGRTFEAKWVRRYCHKCGDPACSWCNRCSCDPTDTGRTCPNCFIRWTPVEVAAGEHEC